ncbi:MAG: hypothetical protein M3526_04575 [Actinomycetota bacterium]|nr:hypothetical protein [Actinomycetota bacterium]
MPAERDADLDAALEVFRRFGIEYARIEYIAEDEAVLSCLPRSQGI